MDIPMEDKPFVQSPRVHPLIFEIRPPLVHHRMYAIERFTHTPGCPTPLASTILKGARLAELIARGNTSSALEPILTR